MAGLLAYYSEAFMRHRDPGGAHPERPERLAVALRELLRVAGDVEFREPSASIGDEVVREVHSREYVEFVRRESSRGFHYIDPDTYVCEGTFDAAVTAVNSAWEAAERCIHEPLPVVALVRPPGHHAGRSGRALGAPTNGFCIFNNVAAAVRRFRDLGMRVLVLDFDAHHGNGTQEILWEEDVPHVDLHEWGAYPGSGWFTDVGGGPACKVNIPLPHRCGDRAYLWAVREVVIPAIRGFAPDVIAVSAGFDAHEHDLLTSLRLSGRVFEVLGSLVSGLRECGAVDGAVAVLEGGYLPGLAEAFAGFVKGLLRPVGVDELVAALPESPGRVEAWFRRGCAALVRRLRRSGLL